MRLITIRSQVKDVAKRWESQYGGNEPRGRHGVLDKLKSLDTDIATARDVAEIIGNDTWVGPIVCDECNTLKFSAVEIGEPSGWDTATACVCEDCMRKAVLLFENAGD